jgi:hypothetical protein
MLRGGHHNRWGEFRHRSGKDGVQGTSWSVAIEKALLLSDLVLDMECHSSPQADPSLPLRITLQTLTPHGACVISPSTIETIASGMEGRASIPVILSKPEIILTFCVASIQLRWWSLWLGQTARLKASSKVLPVVTPAPELGEDHELAFKLWKT